MASGALVRVTCEEVLQLPLTIVHCNTVVLPAVTPVTPEVAELSEPMLPGPLTMVQVPVPGEAVLPARVKSVLLHC